MTTHTSRCNHRPILVLAARTAAALAAVAALTMTAAACGSSGSNATEGTNSTVQAGDSSGSSGLSSDGSGSSGASTTTAVATDAPGIWPPSDSPAAQPLDAVKAFATGYLDVPQPYVNGCEEVSTSSPEQCTATIKARGQGATTTVHLVGTEGAWRVASASGDDIKVTAPAAGASVSTSITIDGQSTAFEGTIAVELRAADWAPANKHVLAHTTLMGGANGTLGPLHGTLAVPDGTPPGPAVLVLYAGDASGQGTATEATVIPIVIT